MPKVFLTGALINIFIFDSYFLIELQTLSWNIPIIFPFCETTCLIFSNISNRASVAYNLSSDATFRQKILNAYPHVIWNASNFFKFVLFLCHYSIRKWLRHLKEITKSYNTTLLYFMRFCDTFRLIWIIYLYCVHLCLMSKGRAICPLI